MAIMKVTSGEVRSGITLDSSLSMEIYSSGKAEDTIIRSAGVMAVLYKGSAVRTSVYSSGSAVIFDGGYMNSTLVHNMGGLEVSSGGTGYNTEVYNGGELFVRSGGSAVATTIHSGGWGFIGQGGTALNTIVESRGLFHVGENGNAVGAQINSAGRMFVSSGGTATGTTLSGEWAQLLVQGVALNNTVNSGLMVLNSGGWAEKNVVNDGGSLNVNSKCAAISTTVNSGGVYNVIDDGRANSTTVNSGGKFKVSSGGLAYNATVNNGGAMTVYEGGKAYSGTVVSSGGNLVLSSGGVANDVTLADSAAFLYVMGGGEANDIKINNRGQTMIFSGGTVNSASFDHGSASVQGVLNSASVANWGLLLARSGGTINNAAVYDLGELRVSQGGFANNITVNSGGVLTGYDNGRIYNATINSGGELSLYSGINLSSATVRSGGWAFVNGAINVVNFVVNGTIYVSSGGRMEQTPGNFTLGSGAMLKISKGGYVDGANVRSGAQVTVESGGTFGAEISGGRVMARTGALLDGVILKSGSVLEAAAYAGLKDVVVSSGGSVTGALRKTQNLTFSGGTLDLNIAMASENDDYLVDSASYADFKTDSYDVTLSIANKQMNGAYKLITGASGFNKTITVKFIGNVLGTLTVNGGPTNVGGVTCDLTLNSGNLVVTVTGGAIPDPIYSGATLIDERKDITSGMSAIDIKVSSGGILNVFSSGIASNTTVYADGEFNLNSKGILRDATIHSGGTATIYEDTRTQNVVVDGGTLNVESDAFITFTSSGKLVSSNVIVSNGGKLNLNGGWVEGALISGGQVMIVSEGSMFAASVANGDVLAKDGGFAGMTIMDGGVVTLASGGTGSCTVSSGGTMRLEDGSDLHGLRVLEGGVVTGVMHGIYSVVTFYKGTLDLDISGVAPSNEYLYDMDANLDFSHGMSCTLTVKGYQENGTYNLMESAYEYDTQVITAETPLTVKGTDGSELGTLTVGQTAYINGASYTLNLSSDHHLTITIEGATPPPPTPTPGSAKSDVDGNGISDVLFQYTGGFGQIGFWMNGTSEWKSTNSTHPTDVWEVLGAYDMNANGKADSVLVGNTEISGIKGAFIGYYLDAEDFDSNWVNISYLTNSEGYVWKNKVGNLTGNAGMNSIVWHCTDIGALGVWTDGTDNWMSLGAGYDSNWTLIGCGDFDGNGKDSVVMSYLNGAKYYTVDLDETLEGDKGVAKELATSDSGWAVRAIGDFSGDGKDDIVAFHQETGLVAMWGDGDSAKWSQLGQLDAADWFVVGAGDYNGDAKDDLLVRQYSTGMLGYYTSGDMAQWNVLGYGVDMSWTVIA